MTSLSFVWITLLCFVTLLLVVVRAQEVDGDSVAVVPPGDPSAPVSNITEGEGIVLPPSNETATAVIPPPGGDDNATMVEPGNANTTNSTSSTATAETETPPTSAPQTKCQVPPLTVPPHVPAHPYMPLIIAHRGASAHLPEHTLESYRLALELGADYVQPDLVATKDGQLIAMHSMDLNLTTDVSTQFPTRSTPSTYFDDGRIGFWSYEFTLEELKTLKVKQRLPELRSTAMDGMFEIPTLTEILELIHEWNTKDQLRLTTEVLDAEEAMDNNQRGIYVEFKDVPWLKEEAKMDMLDLWFDHMDKNADLWEAAILPKLCPTKLPKEYHYQLPPLFVQSFEAQVLKDFVIRWKDTVPQTTVAIPPPPTILLLQKDKCDDDAFWFDLGKSEWREFISGIGPDKACLFGAKAHAPMEHARKYELIVHPWTVRPEVEYLVDPNHMMTAMDELHYLLCTVGVHGVFTESISGAIVAAQTCPSHGNNDKPSTTSTTTSSNGNSNSHCPSPSVSASSGGASVVYVAMAFFVAGIITMAVLAAWWRKRTANKQRSGEVQVPRHAVMLTDDEDRML